VSRYVAFGQGPRTRKVRYRLTDYFLRFYFTFIHPNRERIERLEYGLTFQTATANRWESYLGYAFEQFVHDHAACVASAMGFDEIHQTGSYWQRPPTSKKGIQIDLLIHVNSNTLLVCECKWSRSKTGTGAVDALRERVKLLPNPKLYTLQPVVVTAAGVTRAVQKQEDIEAVTLADFFSHGQ